MRAAAVNPKKVQIANIAPKNFTVDQQHDEWFLREKITRRVDASQSLRNLSRNVVPSKELGPVAPDSRVILPRQLRKVCRPPESVTSQYNRIYPGPGPSNAR